MTVTVFFGISALTVLSVMRFRLSPALAVIPCGWPLTAGRTGRIKSGRSRTTVRFQCRLALVVGSFISAGTLTADFVRLVAMPNWRCWWRWWPFSSALVDVYFRCSGRCGTGDGGYLDVMIAQGLLLPAIVVLGLNTGPPTITRSMRRV